MPCKSGPNNTVHYCTFPDGAEGYDKLTSRGLRMNQLIKLWEKRK